MARLRGRSGFLTSVSVGTAREMGAVASSGVLIGFWGPGGRANAEAVAWCDRESDCCRRQFMYYYCGESQFILMRFMFFVRSVYSKLAALRFAI